MWVTIDLFLFLERICGETVTWWAHHALFFHWRLINKVWFYIFIYYRNAAGYVSLRLNRLIPPIVLVKGIFIGIYVSANSLENDWSFLRILYGIHEGISQFGNEKILHQVGNGRGAFLCKRHNMRGNLFMHPEIWCNDHLAPWSLYEAL